MNLQAYNFYFPSFQTSTSTFRWVTGYLKKGYFKIALKIIKNGLSLMMIWGRFSWRFSTGLPQYFCRILKPLKWAFQNWSYMFKKSKFWGTYALLKFAHEKRKGEVYIRYHEAQMAITSSFLSFGSKLLGLAPVPVCVCPRKFSLV